jgi:hypothetical protein
MEPDKTYRVVRLVAENYKRIKAADVTPNRHVQRVAGVNSAGKTSLLESIAAALGGKKQMAAKPLRKGAEDGTILCVLGDREPELLVKRAFTSDGKTALEITSADGYKAPSPQAILDSMCHSVAFDPLEFSRMGDRQQAETLRELVGLDFSENDSKRKALFDERTAANRDIKSLKARAEAIVVPDGTPEEAVSVADLMAEQSRIACNNESNRKQREKLERARQASSVAHSRLEDARVALEKAEADYERCQIDLDAHERTCAVLEDLDGESVRLKILGAEDINTAVQRRGEKAKLIGAAALAEAQARDISEHISSLDAIKAKRLSEIKWPVDGLSFGEDGVIYNEVPFSQAGAAEKLKVSFAMAAAAHPQLRIALIRDASLLDDTQMAIVSDLAEEYDMQVWLEVVDKEAGPCGVLIEDGAVTEGGTPPDAPPPKKPRRKRKKKEERPSVQVLDEKATSGMVADMADDFQERHGNPDPEDPDPFGTEAGPPSLPFME